MQAKKTYYFSSLTLVIVILFISFGYKQAKYDEQNPLSLIEYNKAITKSENVLVYFHASWCTVCAKMNPMINEIDSTYKVLKVLKVNTEVDKEVAKALEIDAMPVLILYKNGKIDWIYVGFIEKDKLEVKISYLK